MSRLPSHEPGQEAHSAGNAGRKSSSAPIGHESREAQTARRVRPGTLKSDKARFEPIEPDGRDVLDGLQDMLLRVAQTMDEVCGERNLGEPMGHMHEAI